MDSAHSFGVVHMKGDSLLAHIMLSGAMSGGKKPKLKGKTKMKKSALPVPVLPVTKRTRKLPKLKSV
jgi:hypothetical protein